MFVSIDTSLNFKQIATIFANEIKEIINFPNFLNLGHWGGYLFEKYKWKNNKRLAYLILNLIGNDFIIEERFTKDKIITFKNLKDKYYIVLIGQNNSDYDPDDNSKAFHFEIYEKKDEWKIKLYYY